MRIMTMRPGRGDAMSRQLTAADLPIPQTNAQVERSTRDSVAARQRGLLRVGGFGDGEGDVVAAGGTGVGVALSPNMSIGKAVVVGVGVTVAAGLVLRMLDRVWR